VAIVSATDANTQRNNSDNSRATAQAEAGRANTAQAESNSQRINADKAKATAEAEAGRANTAQATAVANLKEAQTQRNLALSRQLAAQSTTLLRNNQTPIALLVALEALKISETKEARNSLIDGINLYPSLLKILPGKNSSGDVNTIAISPNNKLLAMRGYKFSNPDNGSWDISILDIESSKVLFLVKVSSSIAVRTDGILEFSPDNKFLAVATPGNLIQLIDVLDGKVLQQFQGHARSILDVAFSQDGKTIASASWDNTVALWDTATGTQKGAFDAVAYKLKFLPDGKTLAGYGSSGNQMAYWLWDVTTLQLLKKENVGQYLDYSRADFSPDGTKLVSSVCKTADKNICTIASLKIVELDTGKLLGELNISYYGNNSTILGGSDQTFIKDIAFSSDNQSVAFLIFSNQQYGINIWNGKDKVPEKLLENPGRVNSLLFSPDGKLLITEDCDYYCVEDEVKFWSVNGDFLKSVKYEGNSGNIPNLAITQNGKVIAPSSDGNIRIWDTATGKQSGILGGHKSPANYVRISPDGKFIASASDDKTVRLWELDSGKEIRQFNGHNGKVKTVSFSSDGKLLISGGCISSSYTGGDAPFCGSGEIIIWDVQTGRELKRIDAVGTDFSSLEMVPNEKQFVTGACDQLNFYVCTRTTLIFWNLETGQEIRRINLKFALLSVLTFSSDGKTLGLAGCDRFEVALRCIAGQITLLNATTGQQIGSNISAHPGIIYAFGFSPDGKYFISGSCAERNTWKCSRGELAVWDAATLRQIGPYLKVGTGYVHSLAFTPNGKSFISVECSDIHEANKECLTDELQLWTFQSLETQACRIANRNLTLDEWKQYLGDQPYRKTCPDLP